MKKILFILFSVALFIGTACRNEPSSQNETTATTKEGAKPALTRAELSLTCEEPDEPNMEYGAPQHEVFLYLAESKIKIADVLACETIGRDEYESYQIPADAIMAVGGWWAGAGDYFYVAEEGGNFVVKKGEMYEEKEDNSYDYKTVMTFSKTGEEVF